MICGKSHANSANSEAISTDKQDELDELRCQYVFNYIPMITQQVF